MTRSRNPFRNWITALCGAAALIACATVLADPPGRVARLAQINGTVSFSPAGEDEWVLAQPNRPLITGDRVWSDAGSRAELQIGTASARLGSNTSATILNLDDRVAQIEIAQGTVNVRVRRVYADQVFEIDTPNLAFSIRRAGDYRIDVDPNGDATIVRVRSGQGEAWGEGAAYVVSAGQQYTFQGEGLRDYYVDPLPPPDEFDRWSLDRSRREDAAVSARYVSPEVVGYSDLDEYGTWRNVESYGNMWFPTAVESGWVPYRTGHWGWIDPWGWTWIDEAPWGFAPFHYGRWAYVSNRWGWVPGPIAVRPIYAPALVAFIGGGGFSLSVSTGPGVGIGWFPLGPGDVYRPSYAASRTYFTNVNVTNTVVNTTVVNNVYNNVNVTNIVYRNREAPGAVTAVPTAAFTGAQPVSRHMIQVPREVITREPVSNVVAIAPSRASVLAVGAVAAGAAAGAAAVAVAKRPPPAALERRVVAKTAPPPAPPSFATKQSLLAAQPGKPLEPEKLKGMQPARAAEAQKFKVVAPTGTPQPLSKEGGGKGARAERAATQGPTSPGAATAPQPPQDRAMKESKGQDRAMREGKGGPPPQGAEVPRQPQAMREGKGGPPPQAAPVPQPPQDRATKEGKGQERAMREGKGGPPPQAAPVPQAPPQEQMKERRGGPPQAAPVPQAPPQEQMKERRGGPPQAAPVPQPPPQEQMKERRGGPPQGAPAPQAPPQEQMKERRGGPPQGASVPQAPPQEQMKERRGGPPQGAPVPPPQERVQRAPPPPQAAPVPQPPPQERAQKAPPSPQAAPAPQPPPQERGKGKDKDQKDKDKERKEGQ